MAVAASIPARTPPGVWANPANSVHVAFRSCGSAICGKVVWADAKAKADARRGSSATLVGSTLFRDFVPEGPGRWSGSVYVPDIDHSMSGTLQMVDDRTLRGQGCVMRGFGCKTQTWTRIN